MCVTNGSMIVSSPFLLSGNQGCAFLCHRCAGSVLFAILFGFGSGNATNVATSSFQARMQRVDIVSQVKSFGIQELVIKFKRIMQMGGGEFPKIDVNSVFVKHKFICPNQLTDKQYILQQRREIRQPPNALIHSNDYFLFHLHSIGIGLKWYNFKDIHLLSHFDGANMNVRSAGISPT